MCNNVRLAALITCMCIKWWLQWLRVTWVKKRFDTSTCTSKILYLFGLDQSNNLMRIVSGSIGRVHDNDICVFSLCDRIVFCMWPTESLQICDVLCARFFLSLSLTLSVSLHLVGARCCWLACTQSQSELAEWEHASNNVTKFASQYIFVRHVQPEVSWFIASSIVQWKVQTKVSTHKAEGYLNIVI